MLGAADETKVVRLIKEAERENVVVVAIQEKWLKKQRFNEEVQRMLASGLWSWHSKVRRRQKEKTRKEAVA